MKEKVKKKKKKPRCKANKLSLYDFSYLCHLFFLFIFNKG